MKSTNELLKQVEYLHDLLEDYATGVERSNDSDQEYTEIRQELIKDKAIKDNLPKFILECRNLWYFWNYIKPRFRSYAERRDYLREEFYPLYNFIEENNVIINRTDPIVTDLFKHQFPIGMPFSIKKPHVASIPYKGSQKIYFENEIDVGVIRENVYPNFTYQKLENCLKETLIGNSDLKSTLTNMSQTEHEKLFFKYYADSYDMWNSKIPVLIPQAWIQWHSSTKKNCVLTNLLIVTTFIELTL